MCSLADQGSGIAWILFSKRWQSVVFFLGEGQQFAYELTFKHLTLCLLIALVDSG